MPRSIVTGGAGFIGSHVVKRLLSMGHEVVVLDDLSGGFLDNVPGKATFEHGSICDHELVNSLFKRYQFDYVYHLAAYAAEGLSHFIKRFNYTNNLIGSMNLINASVNTGVKRFIFTSSIAVYGKQHPPMTEDMIPIPEDSYGIAKYAVEQELRISDEMFGLPYTIFRPHNVFGCYQNISDRYRNVIGIFMRQALRGEPMTIFGDGEQKRAFTYIDDVAPLIANAIEYPVGTYNLGSDETCTVNQLSKIVSTAMGVPHKVNYLPARNETVSAYSSHTKTDSIFGKKKRVSLEEGIEIMAEWVKRKGAGEPTRFKDIEITKNLPGVWR